MTMLAEKITIRDTDHEQEIRRQITEQLIVTSEAPTTAHRCASCGSIIALTDEDWVPHDDRGPCPVCGAMNTI